MNSNKPILYAEDEENDVFLMERAFKRAEITNPLSIVPDGKLAVEYLSGTGGYTDREAHPMPGLILLDLNMTGKHGLDVLEWLRAQPATSTLLVLVFTSSTQDRDVHRAYSLGANGYLIKPGKPDELLVTVKLIKDYWLVQNRMPPECVDFAAGEAED